MFVIQRSTSEEKKLGYHYLVKKRGGRKTAVFLPLFLILLTLLPLSINVPDQVAATNLLAIAPWMQQEKLTASDSAAGDDFGWAMMVDGDTVVIGARLDDDGGKNSGSAYVFVRSGNSWSQQAKLTASDAAADDVFGTSVALSGDTVVIGASRNDDNGVSSGSAYVFVRSGSNWSQQVKLTAGDAASGDYFGTSVAVLGDTAIIGAYRNDGGSDTSGSVYVFVRSGSSWSLQAKLSADDAATDDFFGTSVAVSGDTVVIGASGNDDSGNYSGSAYVFVRSGSSWSQQAKLTADDAAAEDWFGRKVAVSGDTIIIGVNQDDDDGVSSGSAYVFVRSGSSWSQQAKLTADDAAAYDYFGRSVAVSGDTAIIGASGDDDGGNWSGSAYVFVRSGSSWGQQAKLIADDIAEDDRFGYSVAVDGNTVLIGAIQDDDGGSDSGSAYTFTITGLAIDDITLAEGDSGTTIFDFTITRTDNSEAISVQYATADNTATMADTDYTHVSGTVNFTAGGSLTQQISVQVNGDVTMEENETFVVNLSNVVGNAMVTDGQGVGSIINDDTAGIILSESEDNTAVIEGGITDGYTLVLTSKPTADVVVTIDPDEQTDVGYGAGNSISLTFIPVEWDEAQMVTVTAVDDNKFEGSHSSTITHSISSSDTNYNEMLVADISVNVTDNEMVYIFLPMIVNN